MADKPIPPPPGAVNRITPKLAEITQQVLFGDVWERKQLSKRDRSLITCAVLTALYRPSELKFHLKLALTNGVTREELGELMTHVAFYAGWPCAVQAAQAMEDALKEAS